MSNERIHHKGDCKDHHRHADSDDARQLSQHVQHSMKHKGSRHDSHHLQSSFNKHLPNLKITAAEDSAGSAAAAIAEIDPVQAGDVPRIDDQAGTEDPRLEQLSKKFGVKLKKKILRMK